MARLFSISVVVFIFASSVPESAFSSSSTATPKPTGSSRGYLAGGAQIDRDFAGDKLCNDNTQRVLQKQLKTVQIDPPPSQHWKAGASYGDYLQGYFRGVCDAYAGGHGFNTWVSPCPGWSKSSDELTFGFEVGKRVAAAADTPRDYCLGDAKDAAELARKSFIQVLNTADAQAQPEYLGLRPDDPFRDDDDKATLRNKQQDVGTKRKHFVRGFVRGLCYALAMDSCQSYVSPQKALTSFEPVLKKSGSSLTSPDAISTIDNEKNTGKGPIEKNVVKPDGAPEKTNAQGEPTG